MYILTFKRARSKYFEEGLDLAIQLGGKWDGETLRLEIPGDQLLGAYDTLLPLFFLVQHWSSLRATYNGKPVNPYRFILYMKFVRECSWKSTENPRNCYSWVDVPGWGCKKLDHIFYVIRGSGKYSSNEKYWYNFGHFKKNVWVIDKETLLQRLKSFALKKGLNRCPHFDMAFLEKAVQELPVKIIPDGVEFRYHYDVDYYKGKEVKVPVNIRHISEEWDDFDYSEKPYTRPILIPIVHKEGVEVDPKASRTLLRKPLSKN